MCLSMGVYLCEAAAIATTAAVTKWLTDNRRVFFSLFSRGMVYLLAKQPLEKHPIYPYPHDSPPLTPPRPLQ